MNIDFKFKNFFFDRKIVLDHFGEKGKTTIRALSRAGAFLRTRARSMLRRRKRSASSGQAPSIHTSDSTVTLRNVQFAYDFATSSVVVGTIRLNTAHNRGGGPVPKLLEFGGMASRPAHRGGTRTAHYKPHPWMGPSLKAEIAAGTVPACWSAVLTS